MYEVIYIKTTGVYSVRRACTCGKCKDGPEIQVIRRTEDLLFAEFIAMDLTINPPPGIKVKIITTGVVNLGIVPIDNPERN